VFAAEFDMPSAIDITHSAPGQMLLDNVGIAE